MILSSELPLVLIFPMYTHNLMTLAKRIGLYEALSDEQKDLIDILTPLNLQARYPKDKDEWAKSLDKRRCKNLLKVTKELFEWTKQSMRK